MKLTLPQQDIYFEQLLYPNEAIYNIGATIEIRGQLDFPTARKAFVAMVDQHDALRMQIKVISEEAHFHLREEHHSDLPLLDFSKSKDAETAARNYIRQNFLEPIDLFAEEPFRFVMIRVREDLHYLLTVCHHIITDGWGTSLLFQRFVRNYNELLEHGEVKSEYPFSYADFAREDGEYEQTEAYAKDRQYWLDKFADLPDAFLPRIDENLDLNKSAREVLALPRPLYQRMGKLAKELRCSTFHLILGVLYAYFGRKHQLDDLSIGLPVLNRSKAVYKKTAGLFMGVAPLRIKMDFDKSFAELIRSIRQQLRLDYRHQRFPLGKLVKGLQLFEEKKRLFNITLSYEKQNYADDFTGTKIRVIPLSHQSERVGLAIYVREFDEAEDVMVDFDYNLNYFDTQGIKKLLGHFEKMLLQVLDKPELPLSQVPYLTELETAELQYDFNATQVDLPATSSFLELITQASQKQADKTAVFDGQATWTYKDLEERANQVARYLNRALGEDKAPIGVLLDRSATMLVLLLGIMKSGRAYIPLDPFFPEERLRYILRHSESKVLLRSGIHRISELSNIREFTVEEVLEKAQGEAKTALDLPTADTMAYLIYTSGSTGQPKGVAVGHQSLLNFLLSMQKRPGIATSDLWFSVTTYAFDISILEFWGPLITGATVFMADQDTLANPNALLAQLQKIKPTIIQATPSFYQMLYNVGWQGDDRLKVLCGGDLLSETLAGNLLGDHRELWNMYGPTETTIWSSVQAVKAAEAASTIGQPIDNTQIYILDQFLQLLPVGVAGTIYIGGAGLAQGYYQNLALTDERFIRHTLAGNARIYNTGDVGRWNEKGEVEFLGREDNQVKVRGYRIELGEIEAKLRSLAQVQQAVVLAPKNAAQEVTLTAFIIPDEMALDQKLIINQLRKLLPEYMIPYRIVALASFPLTPNQKIDRKKLLESAVLPGIAAEQFQAPQSKWEKRLAIYWKQFLGLSPEEINVNESFFSLGGHSLTAVKLIGQLKRDYGIEILLRTMFKHATIADLALYLEDQKPSARLAFPKADPKPYYPLTPAQRNIWLAAQQEELSIAYNMSAQFVLTGNLDQEKFAQALTNMVRDHEILRTNFIERKGESFQFIRPYESLNLSKLVITDTSLSSTDWANRPFDLEEDLLLRCRLQEVAQDQYQFIFSTHHLIMDGWSIEVFSQEFIARYHALLAGEEWVAKTETLRFRDYSEWQCEQWGQQASANSDFWSNYLQGYVPQAFFRRDFDGGRQKGGRHTFSLPDTTSNALQRMLIEQKVTLHTFLALTLSTLLAKISGRNDIALGVVNAGRLPAVLQDQLGMFVKTLLLRQSLEENDAWVDLLPSTQAALEEVNAFSDLPYDQLTSEYFEVLLIVQQKGFRQEALQNLQGLEVQREEVPEAYCRLPFIFNFIEEEKGIRGLIQYNADHYAAETIELIQLKLNQLLEQIVTQVNPTIAELDLQLAIETNDVVDIDFNF